MKACEPRTIHRNHQYCVSHFHKYQWKNCTESKYEGLPKVCGSLFVPVLFTGPGGCAVVVKYRGRTSIYVFCSSCTAHSPCGGNKSFIGYYIETFTMECDQHKQPSLLKCNTLNNASCYAKSKWIVCQTNQPIVRLQDMKKKKSVDGYVLQKKTTKDNLLTVQPWVMNSRIPIVDIVTLHIYPLKKCLPNTFSCPCLVRDY